MADPTLACPRAGLRHDARRCAACGAEFEAKAAFNAAVESAMQERDSQLEEDFNTDMLPNLLRRLEEQEQHREALEGEAAKAQQDDAAARREADQAKEHAVRMATIASDAEKALQDVQRAWQRVTATAVKVLSEDAARVGIWDIEQRMETVTHEYESRLERLTDDFYVLFVEPATQRLKDARLRSEETSRIAEELALQSNQAEALKLLAESSIASAMQIIARPKLIVPFNVPEQWQDLVELKTLFSAEQPG